MPQEAKKWLLMSCLVLGLAACARTMVELEFPQLTSPIEAYGELRKLAVGIDSRMDPDVREDALKAMKGCAAFTEVAVMDKPVRVKSSNPKDYFDALIKRSDLAQSSQGVLSLQIEDSSQTEQLEKSQALQVEDLSQEDWFPAYGLPRSGTLGFPQGQEIAPRTKLKRREAFVRVDKSQYILRMVLYNRVSGRIVHDRLFSLQASLHNYSRRPSVKKADFQKLVEKSVVQEALFHVCPIKEQVSRQLLYARSGGASDAEINEGVDLAREDRWSLAGTKWTNVLIKDDKNPIAHHNLGVHYERLGEFFKGIEHYKAAQGKALPIPPVYPRIQSRYLPKVDGSQFYPQVAFISGGSWAYLHYDGERAEQKRASLYRIESTFSPETSRVTGITLREVGLVRTLGGPGPYFPARIREFLLEYPIKAGDLLIGEQDGQGAAGAKGSRTGPLP